MLTVFDKTLSIEFITSILAEDNYTIGLVWLNPL